MVRFRGVAGIVAVLLMGNGVLAQTPATRPAAPQSAFNEPMTKQRNSMLVQRFTPLFADIYAMTPEQKQALTKTLENIAHDDLEYFRSNDAEMTKALADIRLYSQKMTEQTSKDPVEREKLVKLQDAAMTKYRGYQLGSPMSIDKIAEAIEKTLPKEQAEKGHQVFLQRKPYGLRPPPTATPIQQINHPIPPTMPSDPKLASPTQYRTATLAAPAVERWPGIVEAVIEHHMYTDDQKAKARAILHDIQTRVEAGLKKNADAIALAEKDAASPDRDKKLAELYRDVDLGYDELRQRVEQLGKAGQAHATTTLDFAPPVNRWNVAVERIITARNYNAQQAGDARKALADAMKKGDAFISAHGSELATAGRKPDQMHSAYEPLDKIYQELKAAVEKLGPPPAEAPTMPQAHSINGH